MMFVFIRSWWQSLRLVVLAFEGYFGLHRGVLLLIMACLLLHDRYVWSYCFLKNVSNLAGCVTLCCRLLVDARSLRLVVLVFEEWHELCRNLVLFVVGCLLLCDCYDWSYWFSKSGLNFMGICYPLL